MSYYTSRPYGDPGAMRGVAGRLSAKAGALPGFVRDAEAALSASHFAGPAATRFASDLHGLAVAAGTCSSILRAVADHLMARAAQLEAEQAAYDLAIQRARESAG